MYLIRQLECDYYDIRNNTRDQNSDRIKELHNYKSESLKDARKMVLQVLDEYGGIRRLSPKIIMQNDQCVWIECEIPFQKKVQNGAINIKCLAFEILPKSDIQSLSNINEIFGSDFLL